jgi:hypothetical protein
MPEGAVFVGRPSRWGNPFHVEPDRPLLGQPTYRCTTPTGFDASDLFLGREHDRATAHRQAVDLFTLHIGPMGYFEWDDHMWQGVDLLLRGHDLACWCPLDVPCHADVLIELANT